ncbi:hypothetical protein SIN8267_00235 [Sinobacterium norvegicum]|uniref:FHA domain-containing protein n=1 Tax=Sinobacterium norvegicum TaxID=1641715 RepID=A0ABM9AAD1_9GAMM|nr:type VI secretion system-associated FHA domain protein TagH [Sinobacterium norvegicum]CAH0990150.1 hypothetical protein SIN8267_00235 [Sinobacterium norvegicum]
MDLVLTVISGPSAANMEDHTKTFSQAGGSFGRSPDNDWMLPDIDRVVSSTHAKIQQQGDKFLLVDLSTNGTFINGSEQALGANNKHTLSHGDTICAGDFELSVAFAENSPALANGLESVDFLDQSDKTQFNPGALAQESDSDAFDDWLSPQQASAADIPQQPISNSSSASSNDWGSSGAMVDDALFQMPVGSSDPMAPIATNDILASSPSAFDQPASTGNDDWWTSEPDNSDPLAQAIEVPDTQLNAPSTADWPAQNTTPEFQAPPTIQPQIPVQAIQQQAPVQALTVTPQPTQTPDLFSPAPASITNDATHTPGQFSSPPTASSNNTDIARDLGLQSLSDEQLEQLSPELALIVKETLNRLIDLLRARSSIKNELRVDRTMIENNNNNPLKFSVAAEDALAVMFSAQAQSFMPPHLAVADGFNDISDHQVAVMSGMKAAYEFMLEQFSPERIKNLHRQKRGGILSSKDAQNWQGFEHHYRQLQQDKEQTYNTIFGETFANAYEQQLADLKATRSITQHQHIRN